MNRTVPLGYVKPLMIIMDYITNIKKIIHFMSLP